MRSRPTREQLEQMRKRFGQVIPSFGEYASPGEYVIILEAGDKKLTRRTQIRKMPGT